MSIQKRIAKGQAKKPWQNICCEACWLAQEDKCICRCGGAFHGCGVSEDQRLDTVLSPEQAKPFLAQIKYFTCRWCGGALKGEPISYYEHEGGWQVKDLKEKQWLYIVCPDCGYQWALWKLGVDRGFNGGE